MKKMIILICLLFAGLPFVYQVKTNFVNEMLFYFSMASVLSLPTLLLKDLLTYKSMHIAFKIISSSIFGLGLLFFWIMALMYRYPIMIG